MRDLGGHPTESGGVVRHGLVFRAASLHRFGGAGLPALATLIDLRSPGEIARGGPCPPIGDASVVYAPILHELWGPTDYDPAVPLANFLAERYVEMAEVGREAIGASLAALADPDALPAAFFCAAGKDRTGVLAAVLLSVLGVADEHIASDYGSSDSPVRDLFAWLRANPAPGSDWAHGDNPLIAAPAAAMLSFLEKLREGYGSPDAYARGAGLSDAAIAELRTTLTRPSPRAGVEIAG
ncbi:MAG: protein-tyrosine phosphatase [Solirubrobacteraceae bacterium]|nr:protein-tyrosine phosphatase [Solirubrobacteraceae bacterium]